MLDWAFPTPFLPSYEHSDTDVQELNGPRTESGKAQRFIFIQNAGQKSLSTTIHITLHKSTIT